jgi:hypothetical protein
MLRKILLLIIVVPFFIGWSSNPVVNTPVCTSDHEQKRPQLAADGSGGAVIVWEDSRSGTDYDIYGQLMDSSGAPKWRRGGIPICTALGAQHFPQLAADSSGGFIIAWYDRRGGKNYDIYAQRVDATGRIQWSTNGIAICTADQDQYDPMVVSDGEGGAIIVWQDRRNGNDYDIYAQRIDSAGRVQWNANGTVICIAKEDQDNPRLVSDSKGGAIITWQDRRSGNNYDIFAQRISPEGNVQWTGNGIEICNGENDQKEPQLTAGDNGETIITWQDKRNGKDNDIYAQRIDLAGTTQWTANGISICAAANDQYDPRLVSDGQGGAIITWQDYRKGSDCNFDAFAEQTDLKTTEICEEKQSNDWNIYAQRVDASGRVQWIANGVAICTANVDQFKPQPAADGLGGAIIIWRASDKANDHNLYAQHLDSSGALKWTAKGVAISTAPGNQFDPLLVADGDGGAVVTWYDRRREGDYDIYVQKICASGKIGECATERVARAANSRRN